MNQFSKINVINASDMIPIQVGEPNTLFQFILMLLAGLLLPLAFAPFSYGLFAPLSLTIFVYILNLKSCKQPFLLGYVFGLSYFGLGISWIYVSLYNFGNMSWWLAGIATFFFVAFWALFLGLIATLSTTIKRRFNLSSWLFLTWLFPLIWVTFEWVRSWIFTGLPWLLVGASQLYTPLSNVMPIIGELGTSWVLLSFSGLIALALVGTKPQKITSFLVIAIIWIGTDTLGNIQWTQATGKTIKIVLVQGNIPIKQRWLPDAENKINQTYWEITQKALPADLIIWPETAIPIEYPRAEDKILPMLRKKLKGSALISGIVKINESNQYTNSLIQLSGSETHFYHKSHLVPFGEYTPLANGVVGALLDVLQIPMSNMVPGVNPIGTFSVNNTIIAPSICYEIIFADLVRKTAKESNLLLTVSNDTWFGDSFAPSQHMQIAQVRAKENGKPLIRTTNTGITAIVNNQGQIVEKLKSNEEGFLKVDIQTYQGSTPFSDFGLLWWFVGMMVISLTIIKTWLIRRFLFKKTV